MTKTQNSKHRYDQNPLSTQESGAGLEHLNFGFMICLEFRVSDLGFRFQACDL